MIPKRTKRINAEWLNEALHSNSYLKDVNIESISREPWGAGEGFVSDMARITVTYDKESSEAPKTMIVKMPTTFRTALAIAEQYNIYEREIRFYMEVAPKSPIRVPGVIYHDYDKEAKKYILILEDCSRFEQIDQIKGLNKEQTIDVINAITEFHARWWDSPDLYSFDWMPKPKGEVAKSFVETYRSSWDLSIKLEEFQKILPEGGQKAGEKIGENFPWLVMDIPDDNMTISHFDFRVDNLFFDYDNKENPILIIDWGSTVVNGGLLDIGYLLSESVEIDLRRKIEKDMIKHYIKQLEKKGITGIDFDFAWENYLKALMCYAWIPAIAYSQLDRSDPRAVKLFEINTKRQFQAIIDNDATGICPS
ncbi:MAG: phosphotransferase [Promethearchaeota archaeon]|jgi:thiamine kinase-like enzyme